MAALKEIQFFTLYNGIALPASWNVFFLAAFPDIAKRRATTVPTPLFTSEFDYLPKQFVAFRIMNECLCKRISRNGCGEFFIFCCTQFLSQVACEVGNSSGVPMTVQAAEPTIRYYIKIFLFHLMNVDDICINSIFGEEIYGRTDEKNLFGDPLMFPSQMAILQSPSPV